MTPRIRSVFLETTMANSQASSVVKLFALRVNRMTAVFAARHTGTYCGYCNVATIPVNVSSSNEDLIIVLRRTFFCLHSDLQCHTQAGVGIINGGGGGGL
jgi:hypothetical protein